MPARSKLPMIPPYFALDIFLSFNSSVTFCHLPRCCRPDKGATGAGRGYGVAGGVASAIEECVREYYPDVEVHIEHAESLSECKKMLMLAKAGKKNGCLIEGMACPGGCVAGAGTNIAVPAAAKAVSAFKESASRKIPDQK